MLLDPGEVGKEVGYSMDTLLSRNEIPIVDLGHMGAVTAPVKPWVKKAANQLERALANKGLVFLVNHGITEEKLQKAYSVMDKFCGLPDDKKAQYNIDPPNDNQGYVAPGSERFTKERQKEARHSYNIQSFSRKIPEEELPGFEETVSQVAQEFKRVASLILQIIAVGLDLDPGMFLNAHQGMMKSDNGTTFRLIYYPPLGEEPLQGNTRCGEHTDYGTCTLLAQDSEGGLEVLNGGKWCRVGHLPGAILVNTGDLLETWTSGKYEALKHRVVIPENSKTRTRGRHSIAFFVHPDDSTVIEPIALHTPKPEMDIDGPKHHIALFTAYQHLQQRLKQSRMLILLQRLGKRLHRRSVQPAIVTEEQIRDL